MRITRAAYSKQSKQNLLNQGKIKKSTLKSHSSLENVFAIDPANIRTRLDKMQVKNPALNNGTIQTRFIVQLK